MSTETGIANSALIKLGASRIASIDDDTPTARIMKEQYPKIRDAVLRSHPWNFAIKRVQLAEVAVPPAFGFERGFQIPNDCLRVLEIDSQSDEWQKEGDQIVSDANAIYIKYISKITESGKFDSCFSEALAAMLAHDTCFAITQSNTLKEQLMKDYKYWIGEARSFDGQEGGTRQVYANEWLNSRY